MTDQAEASTAENEREIEHLGRKFWVRMPGAEQLVVWKRTIVRLQSANESWDGEQVLGALERSRRIFDSVVVHQADKDWLDDEMLDGRVTLQEMSKIILKAVEAFAADKNRADRRAAKKTPAKKAVRKRTPPKAAS